jgi:hypothetical protein
MPGIIQKFKDFLGGKKSDYKIYKSEILPNSKFRRAGKDKRGNINWQAQLPKEETWVDILNLVDMVKGFTPQLLAKLIKDLNSQYQRNLAKQKVKGIVPSNINLQDYWTLITVIACENFSDNLQGMADVAQSIYNRLNVPGQGYGKSIREIILSQNQYEPVSIGKSKGARWSNIKSRKSAIAAYVRTKGQTVSQATMAIENAVKAQKDPIMITSAKKWVQTRTEFLSDAPSDSNAVSVKQRKPIDKHNAFFWNYAGKTHFYDERIFGAFQMPDTVRMG